MPKQALLVATLLAWLPDGQASAQLRGRVKLPQGQAAKVQHTSVLTFNSCQGSGFSFQIKLRPEAHVQAASVPS
jgi:hypothetical protein